MGTKESEISAGKAAIDAAIACSLDFVVFSSVADCDICYDNIFHFKSKFEIENYLMSTTLKYTILRPVSFLDNFDDPSIKNSLIRGSVKGLVQSNVKIRMVACKDVGKAAAQIFVDPEKHYGKTITCVSCYASGEEVAEVLSTVSSEPCKYSTVLPKWAMWLFIPEIARMIKYYEEKGILDNANDIAEFQTIVPDALDVEGFFKMKGRWANGEVFGSVPASSKSKFCSVL
jgi:uncharacterized protein YbjT (DUF2867 family)